MPAIRAVAYALGVRILMLWFIVIIHEKETGSVPRVEQLPACYSHMFAMHQCSSESSNTWSRASSPASANVSYLCILCAASYLPPCLCWRLCMLATSRAKSAFMSKFHVKLSARAEQQAKQNQNVSMFDAMYADREKLETIFRFFDTDGNGSISREEFHKVR